jgi:lipoate---protein ligase
VSGVEGADPPIWRLLDTGPVTAAQNMALDEVLLQARDRDRCPTTLRFLEFSPHCVLVGLHQAIGLEVEEAYCREHGIDVNRRLTGGGAIYLDEGQLGWEVIATRADFPGVVGLEGMFARVGECVVVGLRRLGVEARFRPKNDIEVDGRKLSGTGGTERTHALVYHGTLLTDFDVDTMLQCLRLPISKLDDKQVQGFRQRVTCLRELLGATPPMPVLKRALVDGFAEALGVELVPGPLTTDEQAALAERTPYYASQGWVRGGSHAHAQASALGTVDQKTPGGLLRVAMQVDPARDVVKAAYISGDFFVLPARAILDLEAWLRHTSSRPADLRRRVASFFAANDVSLPGVTVDQLADVVCAAAAAAADRPGPGADAADVSPALPVADVSPALPVADAQPAADRGTA